MFPPTPTPSSFTTSPVTLPDVSLWDMAPHAIATWNSFETAMMLFQVLMVMFIATMLLIRIVNFSRRLGENEI